MKANGSFRKTLLILLSVVMLIGVTPVLLAGCSNSDPKTYSLKSWDEVQSTIDSARSSDIIDLSKLTSPSQQYTLSIPTNFNLAIIGNKDVDFVGVAIDCTGTNAMTIQNLHLVSTNNQHTATISFSGWGNQLILLDDNSIINAQAAPDLGCGAAIGVSEGVTLTISGSGSLYAQAGSSAAGIGGGVGHSSGTITFREGVITACGGDIGPETGGAGIGGGSGGSGGATTISGGEVYAIGGHSAAGIGGGFGGNGGAVTISGGNVTGRGGYEASGIGRGKYGEGVVLGISGGTMTAYGTGIDAIGGATPTMPGEYLWWAGGSDMNLDEPGTVYPPEAFSDYGGFSVVRIQSGK